MLRNFLLSANHYASKWTVKEFSDRHDLDVINQKAIDLLNTDDPAVHETLQLEILEAFHGYLLKYFNLIVYGQAPALEGNQGKDALAFLRLLLAKNITADANSLRYAAKHLHLAFKSCVTSDEVYDTLVTVFLDVCSKYDPFYAKKTEEVCHFIAKQPTGKLIRLEEFAGAVAFDPLGCVRLLVRNGFLTSIQGLRKKIQGYK